MPNKRETADILARFIKARVPLIAVRSIERGRALEVINGVADQLRAMAFYTHTRTRGLLERGGDLHWAGDAGSLRGRPGTALAEKLASRDYTYLLLMMAAINHLEWFLYAAAAGAWANGSPPRREIPSRPWRS